MQHDGSMTDALGSLNLTRRQFLTWLGLSGALFSAACSQQPRSLIMPPNGQTVARLPEKEQLILLTDRPPQLETPLFYFREDLTPNDAFFVRWHYSGIPTSVDVRKFRLNVSGHVSKPLVLSLEDLRQKFTPVTFAAVTQCSGNSRSYFAPPVAGGQWGHGAVGNALWTGVRLRDLLNRTGIKSGAVSVSLAGLDEPPLSNMHKFVKSLTIDHAMQDEVLVAYEMNNAPLPMLNGFPLRLVVPGWYATYWVKSLSHIEVLSSTFKGYWMDKAYRIPNNATGDELPDKLATDTVPINKMTVRSLFVRPDPTDLVRAGKTFEVEGIAFDDGHGIKSVEVSLDGGATWTPARLDDDKLGRFSFRRWRLGWTPQQSGNYRLMVRAVNNANITQTNKLWNKSGYMWNVVEKNEVTVL